MDTKANRRNRMAILKRKRESRNLPSIASRRLPRNTRTTVRGHLMIASENNNPNYTRPFENSVTEIGSGSIQPIPINRTPFTPIVDSVGTQVGPSTSVITTISETPTAQTVDGEGVSTGIVQQVTTARAHI